MMYEIRIKCRGCKSDPIIRVPKYATVLQPENMIVVCPLCGGYRIDYAGHVEVPDR